MTRSLFSPLIRCTGSLLAAGLIVVQTEAAEPNKGANPVRPSSAAVQPAKKFKPDGSPAKLTALIPNGYFEVAADGVYRIQCARSEELEKARKRIDEIVIPKLNIDDKTLPEAIKILTEKSKEADAEKQGVMIELTGYKADTSEDIRISLKLNEVPVKEAIKYVATLANYRFFFEQQTVKLVPITPEGIDLPTTQWEVRPDFIARLHKQFVPDEPVPANAMNALEVIGVYFPEGAIAIYSKPESILTVTGSSYTHELVETALLAADAGCNSKNVALSVYDENDLLIYRRPTNGEPVWKPVPLKAGKRYRFSSMGCPEPRLWLESAAAK